MYIYTHILVFACSWAPRVVELWSLLLLPLAPAAWNEGLRVALDPSGLARCAVRSVQLLQPVAGKSQKGTTQNRGFALFAAPPVCKVGNAAEAACKRFLACGASAICINVILDSAQSIVQLSGMLVKGFLCTEKGIAATGGAIVALVTVFRTVDDITLTRGGHSGISRKMPSDISFPLGRQCSNETRPTL